MRACGERCFMHRLLRHTSPPRCRVPGFSRLVGQAPPSRRNAPQPNVAAICKRQASIYKKSTPRFEFKELTFSQIVVTYLPPAPGGLLPRPPPEGLPVVDGQLPPFPPLFIIMFMSFRMCVTDSKNHHCHMVCLQCNHHHPLCAPLHNVSPESEMDSAKT